MNLSGHNPEVSLLVRASLRTFGKGPRLSSAAPTAEAYLAAYDLAARCLPQRRSIHQDMFIKYAMGSALVRLNHLREGAGHLAGAMYYAEASGDLFATAELAEHPGAALRWLGGYADAVDVYRIGLDALNDLRTITPLQHPSCLKLEEGLASTLQTTERYDEALPRLAIARATALTLGDREVAASVDLSEANVQRARGNPLAALARMLAARDGYAAGDTRVSRLMLGRSHAFAAEMALDVAEMYAQRGQLSLPSTYIDLAGSLARQALREADRTGERGARYFGLMAEARHARSSGRLGSALIMLEPLLGEAAREHDPYLDIQLHTAIGKDYAARGDRAHALAHYRQAMHDAEAVGEFYIGGQARRELLHASQDAS